MVRISKEHDLRKPGCIIVYYDLKKDEMRYERFGDEQKARSWAYENIENIKGHFVLISDYEKSESKKSKDLEFNQIEFLCPPSVKLISSSDKGLFDCGSDVGVLPFDGKKIKPLIHSAEMINDQVKPIVYATLKINGELLEGIHKVNVIAGNWCGFGVPQLQLMSKEGALNILARMIEATKLQ